MLPWTMSKMALQMKLNSSSHFDLIIPSKMEVSTAMMSYDFKMSSDYNHDVLKL